MKYYFLVIIFIFSETTGLKLRIYHSSTPYQGLIYEREHDLAHGRCENVEKYGQRLSATSISTDNCIFVYEKENCDGYSLKVQSPGNDNLNKTVASYHICNETIARVDLYSSNKTLVMKYPELCSCETFPESQENIHSLNNHGNCVTLHEDPQCKGQEQDIPAGRNELSENLSGLPFRPKSISSCSTRLSCFKVEIIGFEITNLWGNIHATDPNYVENSILREEELAPESTFYNSGGATTTQEYKGSKTIQQNFNVSLARTLSYMRNIELSPNFFIRSNITGPFSNSILPSVSKALKAAYSSGHGSKSKNYIEEKTFSLSHSIQIPPCEKYSISSFISIYENHLINYEVHFKMIRIKDGVPIHVGQLKDFVTALKFVEEFDPYSSELWTHSGSIIANFGYATSTKGEGSKIESCKINRELDNPPQERVVGGVKANPGEFPSQVFIRIRASDGATHQCSGSILNPTRILTAAHCFSNTNYQVAEAHVIAGVNNIGTTRWRQTRQMDRVIIHPRFNQATRYNNDIAVVVLKEPLNLNERVKAARLPPPEESEDAEEEYITYSSLTATGWGSSMAGGEPEADLMKVDLSITRRRRCGDIYGRRRVITNNNICADDEGKGTCQGDGGGPALCRKGNEKGSCSGTDSRCVQCGIVSVGHKSCTDKPSVFTKVSNYLDWIKQEMTSDPPQMDCPLKHKITQGEWMKIFNRVFRKEKIEGSSEEAGLDRDHFGNIFE